MSQSIKSKIISSFAITAMIIVVMATIASWAQARAYEFAESDDMGVSAAETCADVFDFIAESNADVTPGTEEAAHYRNLLRNLCKRTGMDYLYVIHCDTEANKIRFIMSVAADDENDKRVQRERPYGLEMDYEFTEVEQRALAGERVTEARMVNNKYGDVLSWFSLVHGWDGKVLAAADYSLAEQRRRVAISTATSLLSILISLLVLLVVQLAVLRKDIFKPIGVIVERMKGFIDNRSVQFEPLGIDTGDEMGQIASAFEEMAADINTYLDDIERMTEQRVQSKVELDVARRIQLGIVPLRKDVSLLGASICAFSRPAREVGGDFYDYTVLGDGRIGLVIGDVSGKGVAAALFMTLTKTMIQGGLASGSSPAEILNKVNAALCESNPEEMFVTVFVAVFDPLTGEVRFANAGHLPPVAVGRGARAIDMKPGVMLGLFDDSDIVEETLVLRVGEGLVLYTDGVTEAVNSNHVFLGQERFVKHLEDCASHLSARELVDAVVDEVDEFAAGCEQFDDLTVVAYMRESVGMIECPVDVASLTVLRKAIIATEADGALKRKACLACEEVLMNIVSYSDADHIWFEVSEGGGSLRITIEDDGFAFDPLSTDSAAKEFDDLDQGGMGINLIKQLAADLSYERKDNRNVLNILVQ